MTRALALTVLLPAVAGAQAVVRGTVATPRGPVAGAQVMLEPSTSAPFLTDSLGRFLLQAGSGGRFRILVRALGNHPSSRTLVVAPDDTLVLDVVLEPNVQELSSVRVEERAIDPVMAPFEERRRAGFGRFITRAMLAEHEHSTLANVLRRSAGIQFVRRPVDCGGGWAGASGRAGSIERQPWMRCLNGVPFPIACYLNVFMDGLQLWVSGSAEPPNLDAYQVASLEAVEVYRSAAEAPIQFQRSGGPCGVLLLWTRRPGDA